MKTLLFIAMQDRHRWKAPLCLSVPARTTLFVELQFNVYCTQYSFFGVNLLDGGGLKLIIGDAWEAREILMYAVVQRVIMRVSELPWSHLPSWVCASRSVFYPTLIGPLFSTSALCNNILINAAWYIINLATVVIVNSLLINFKSLGKINTRFGC